MPLKVINKHNAHLCTTNNLSRDIMFHLTLIYFFFLGPRVFTGKCNKFKKEFLVFPGILLKALMQFHMVYKKKPKTTIRKAYVRVFLRIKNP